MRRWLPIFALLFLATALVRAEDPPKPAPAPVSEQNLVPAPTAVASVKLFKGETREVDIPAHQIPSRPGQYAQFPVLSIVTNPNPLPDMPSAVWDLFVDESGKTVAKLSFRVSSDLMRAALQEKTAVEDSDFAKQAKTPYPVRAWPLTEAAVYCELAGSSTSQRLSSGSTGDLATSKDTFEIWFAFTPADFARFLEAEKLGRVNFTPHYNYEGAASAGGRVKSVTTADVETIITQKLTSEQRSGTAPILQNTRSELEQQIRIKMVDTIEANNVELLQYLDLPSLVPDLFSAAVALRPEKLSEAEQAQLATYLKPHLETLQTETGSGEITVTRKGVKNSEFDEAMRSNTSTEGAEASAAGVGIGSYFAISASGGKSWNSSSTDSTATGKAKEVFDEIQKSTGTSFKQVGKTEHWVASNINVNHLSTARLNAVIERVKNINLELGRFVGRKRGSTISIRDTYDRIEKALLEKLSDYQVTPNRVGEVMFTVNNNPPGPYWVPADGKNPFPTDLWVPEHMRGQPVPDLMGRIVGGWEGIGNPAPDRASLDQLGKTNTAGWMHIALMNIKEDARIVGTGRVHGMNLSVHRGRGSGTGLPVSGGGAIDSVEFTPVEPNFQGYVDVANLRLSHNSGSAYEQMIYLKDEVSAANGGSLQFFPGHAKAPEPNRQLHRPPHVALYAWVRVR